MKAIDERTFTATKLELRAQSIETGDALPKGVCGRLTGICLTYNVADDYDTVFLPGCLSKTIAERVATGKVKLFADHGPYTETHVGVVRSIEDVGDAALMTADLFDTDAGRGMKEYLEAVLVSGADTGLSVGFRDRKSEWRKSPDGTSCLYYTECELREVSITPVPAVPGADVTSVRRGSGESEVDLLKRALSHILRSLPERDARAVFDTIYAGSAAPSDAPAASAPEIPQPDGTAANADRSAESATGHVTMDQRTKAFRESYKVA